MEGEDRPGSGMGSRAERVKSPGVKRTISLGSSGAGPLRLTIPPFKPQTSASSSPVGSRSPSPTRSQHVRPPSPAGFPSPARFTPFITKRPPSPTAQQAPLNQGHVGAASGTEHGVPAVFNIQEDLDAFMRQREEALGGKQLDPTSQNGFIYKAKFEVEDGGASQMSLLPGDLIHGIGEKTTRFATNWEYGENTRTGQKGWFSIQFVDMLLPVGDVVCDSGEGSASGAKPGTSSASGSSRPGSASLRGSPKPGTIYAIPVPKIDTRAKNVNSMVQQGSRPSSPR